MRKNKFTVGVEKLIRPVDVGTLHFVQNMTGALPLKTQEKLVKSSAKTTPLMGFVVEPYSYFLAYKIKDIEWAQSLLPEHFIMKKTKVLKEDTSHYYGIFGIFNAHTSGFWGLRVEFYLIAEDTRTGLLSWIIVDYDTNTISYDPKNGLMKPNSDEGIFTIDYDGIIHVDVKKNDDTHQLVFESDIKNGVMKDLDNRLWVEGNLSIGYGGSKSNGTSEVFSLKFDPKEFDKALHIDKQDIQIEKNTWFEGLIEEEPEVILCFPYAQHFISDSPGAYSLIKDEEELVEEINKVDFNNIKTFSSKPIINMMFKGMIASVLINISLLILLIA